MEVPIHCLLCVYDIELESKTRSIQLPGLMLDWKIPFVRSWLESYRLFIIVPCLYQLDQSNSYFPTLSQPNVSVSWGQLRTTRLRE